MVRDVMPNGAPGHSGARTPPWRNRKIVAAGAAVVAAAVAAIVIALASAGNGAPQPSPHAAATPAASAPASTPQSQPTAASSALASPPRPLPASSASPAGNTHTALVTQAQLGTDWPLTVSSGWVRCVAHSNAYTFRTTGSGARTYALNLAALKLGYPSITAVQIQSQDGTGEPADVSPLQERAASLC
jgi:Protein of unknown function (DUF2511)